MPSSVTVSFRKIATEDILTSSTPAQVSATVLGVGAVNVTPFVLAAGDAAAAIAGVLVGQIYVDSSVTPHRMRARMS